MPSNFIFVESIQKIIQKGEHEIKVPNGTKISPAAFDLIKGNQIQVIYEKKSLPETMKTKEPDVEGLKKDSRKDHEPLIDTSEKNGAQEHEAVPEVTEKDVENITQRVIERLNELKSCKDVHSDEKKKPSTDDDLIICRCEEISKKEIKDVIRSGIATLNGIKRVTRSGMGLCQGQTCQSLVTRILAEELGIHPAKLEPITARAPVRPIRLSVFAGQG